jgi:hypothetical protein
MYKLEPHKLDGEQPNDKAKRVLLFDNTSCQDLMKMCVDVLISFFQDIVWHSSIINASTALLTDKKLPDAMMMIGSSLLTFETLLERQSSQDRLESGYFRE